MSNTENDRAQERGRTTRVANAASDSARCDTCGEPNRTGTSVVYVTPSWCRRLNVEHTEGLKMCIWCRNTMASHRISGHFLTHPDTIRKRARRKAEINEAGGYLNYCWERLTSLVSGGRGDAQ